MTMRYENVCVEAMGYSLPEEVVTSTELEVRLRPVYKRLGLHEGRLERLTGICERRFWKPHAFPSEGSIAAARSLFGAVPFDRSQIGAVVHASVCRDHLEPATACVVHHGLGLARHCQVFDLSNACLGMLNGVVQVANMIELGQIRAGLVVGAESGREFAEAAIAHLSSNGATKNEVDHALASLTIGSGSAAVLLVANELSITKNRLLAAVASASTAFHGLCQSKPDWSMGLGAGSVIHADSEKLMRAGIEAAAFTFRAFIRETGWPPTSLDRVFCHQVGARQRRLALELLGIEQSVDFSTFRFLGNTGAVAVPLTAAIGIEQGLVSCGDRVALLGIGAGINVLMLAIQWGQALRRSSRPEDESTV